MSDFSSMYRVYSNNKSIAKRKDRDSEILESGFTRGQTWGGLKKCWFAYFLSEKYDNIDNRKYYAAGIQKFEHELGIKIYSFHDLKMSALSYMSDNAKYLTGEETGEEIIQKMIDDKEWNRKLRTEAEEERDDL